MKISFIIPVYNVARYLTKCLDSLIRIEQEEIEVILIDDGSSDNSGSICDRYAERDSRIKVIHQKNQGVSVARNNGLNKATGEWICFVDADDFLLDNFEKEIMSRINPVDDIVFFHFTTDSNYNNRADTDGKEEVNRYVCSGEECLNIRRGLLNKDNIGYLELSKGEIDFVAPWGCLYRRELIGGIRFPKGIVWSEDRIFKFSILRKAKNICILNVTGYYYRQHIESTTFKYKANIMDNCYQMCLLMANLIFDEKKVFTGDYDIFVVRQWLYCMQSGVYHLEANADKEVRIKELVYWRNKDKFAEAIEKADLKMIKVFSIRIAAICLKYKLYGILDGLYILKKRAKRG